MAIDFGKKRVGVAISDALCTISQPLLTIKPRSAADLIKRLKCIVDENDVGLIIVGNPISMRGEPTQISREVERFTLKLRRQLDIEVKLWDERFLSKYAMKKFKDSGISMNKDDVDRIAASIMLEEYLSVKRP